MQGDANLAQNVHDAAMSIQQALTTNGTISSTIVPSCSPTPTPNPPAPPTPPPKPAAKPNKTKHKVGGKMTLQGISKAQFTTAAQNGFKNAVAISAGKYCGSAGALRACDLNDVEITSFNDARRDLSVAYLLYVASADAANSATSALKNVTTDQWKSVINAQFTAYGANVQTTGVAVTQAPSNQSSSSSSSSGLSGGAIAGIVIACVVAVGIVVGIVIFFTKRQSNDRMSDHGTAYASDGSQMQATSSGSNLPSSANNHATQNHATQI
jgi:hypothetical protein